MLRRFIHSGHVRRHGGFTLIEVMVSTAIFSMVMVIALGALLALSEADRKAQTLNTAVNNMGSALDSMSRAIRTGVSYYCGSGGNYGDVYDCQSSPGTYLSFVASDGTHVAYCLDNSSGVGIIKREIRPASNNVLDSSCNTPGFVPLTPPDVNITRLSFYVVGSSKSDQLQPKVTILLSGSVQVTATQSSVFNIQSTVTQRIYDQ